MSVSQPSLAQKVTITPNTDYSTLKNDAIDQGGPVYSQIQYIEHKVGLN